MLNKQEVYDKLQEQKRLDLNNSILFCLSKPEAKAFLVFLLDSTNALGTIPSGLTPDSLIEQATLHRVGNRLLTVLLENSPELTGKLITSIKKDEQNERELTRE